MSWTQLRTVLWLRWRLSRNQMARSRTDAVVSWILLFLGLLLSLGSAVGGFLAGWLGLAQAAGEAHLVTWDILVGFFSVLWLVSILVEIQRSEVIDLQRLLHLPVSLRQVFLINYVASHVNLVLLVFGPGWMGLCAGLILADGVAWLLLVPLVLGFVFMVTAWSYCLRGWLVSLMVNKRRRRAILVGLTMGLLLLGQAPNIYFNLVHRGRPPSAPSRLEPPPGAADGSLRPGGGVRPEHVRAVHQWIPLLWLPYGAKSLAERKPGPALWGAAGLFLLGGLGLWRAYRGTLRFYLGREGSKRALPKAAPARTRPSRRPLLEARLPFVPAPADVLTLAFFRSFLRAPEAKMALAVPFVMVVLFGSILFRRGDPRPEIVGVFIPTTLGLFILMGLVQLFANHFGFDRTGFRALVLSPVPRRHVLLGKNLALFAFALGLELIMMGVLLAAMQVSWADWVSGFLQFLTGFLCFCMLGNLASILAPCRIAPGSLKPTKMSARARLMVLAFYLLFPLVLFLVVLPVVWQVVCTAKGWCRGVPVHLIGSALLLGIVLLLYTLSLDWLGRLLQRREMDILQAVTQEIE